MSCIGSCLAGEIAVSQARFPLSSSDLAAFSLAVSVFLLFAAAAVEVLDIAFKSKSGDGNERISGKLRGRYQNQEVEEGSSIFWESRVSRELDQGCLSLTMSALKLRIQEQCWKSSGIAVS